MTASALQRSTFTDFLIPTRRLKLPPLTVTEGRTSPPAGRHQNERKQTNGSPAELSLLKSDANLQQNKNKAKQRVHFKNTNSTLFPAFNYI